jgi:hypothetical protein
MLGQAYNNLLHCQTQQNSKEYWEEGNRFIKTPSFLNCNASHVVTGLNFALVGASPRLEP